jgi:CxxC motif-containing protein (DUF1111 family)
MTRGLRILLALAPLTPFIAPDVLTADPLDAAAGKALFDRQWIPAPSSTNGADGLGPLFTARSCASCHGHGEGARVVTRDDGLPDLAGAVVRFGRADGATDPYYGLELQTHAVPGLMPEGEARFLSKLKYSLAGPDLGKGINAGARLAPSLFGRAEFENVPDAEILKRADPDDRDGDGISGRANVTPAGIGRYGWKAAQVTLEEQIAHAFAFDIGLSSPKLPLPYGDCTSLETACLKAPNGESPAFEGREISAPMLGLVASYVRILRPQPRVPVPAAEALFDATGCAACHVPALTTQEGRRVPAFTDLLLHDMGRALDDGVGEPGVKSSEWRTAPLIDGRSGTGGRRYLHDGSAATVTEAVEKHGGEAGRSRERFEALAPQDKKRLIDYVNGL